MLNIKDVPRFDGWPVERAVPMMAGGLVLGSLALGRYVNPKFRGFTAFVGANLMFYATMSWCPGSLMLRSTGLRSLMER